MGKVGKFNVDNKAHLEALFDCHFPKKSAVHRGGGTCAKVFGRADSCGGIQENIIIPQNEFQIRFVANEHIARTMRHRVRRTKGRKADIAGSS